MFLPFSFVEASIWDSLSSITTHMNLY